MRAPPPTPSGPHGFALAFARGLFLPDMPISYLLTTADLALLHELSSSQEELARLATTQDAIPPGSIGTQVARADAARAALKERGIL